MTTTQLAAWVMLAFGGLYSGAILIYAVDRVHVWRQMPVDQYVVDFRRSLYRADPLIPIMGVLSALGAVVFALNSDSRAAVLAWIGFALIAVIMVASITLAEPVNSQFRRLPEGMAPDRVEQLRITWCTFHRARTVVALGALACLAAASV
ncbi:MAG: DUF1772 domain-containing protein [Mycobacterium sp.]|uniref:anthrone oxygenase family protein n=1 Tax=Mycobacterium sp. TaxID=1785 RepID=UPI001ECB7487|nr:anthrone oxygenase family protein [Mycobacterium sp.]MBV8789784.1 DUF1772 domain-containing protein [Mycobacterium sp.]